MDERFYKNSTKVVQASVENYLQVVELEGSDPSLESAAHSQTVTYTIFIKFFIRPKSIDL